MFTRVVLFAITNLVVLMSASIVMSLLGINTSQMGAVLIVAVIFGFGGSIISLLMSKVIAKRTTGACVIEQPRNPTERWLLETVHCQAQQCTGSSLDRLVVEPDSG